MAKGGVAIDPTIKWFIIGFTGVSLAAVGVIVVMILLSQGKLAAKGPPDLAVVITSSPNPVQAGASLIYTVNISNEGGGDATRVVLTNILSSGVSFASSSPSAPSCKEAGGNVTCNLGDKMGLSTGKVRIFVTVDPSTVGDISYTASVTAEQEEDTTANNTATQITTVQ